MDTMNIVLIHGLWMTGRAWEKFTGYYTQAGHHAIAPHWPGLSDDITGIRRDPSALAGLGIGDITDHYESIVRSLDAPPLLIGHSMGGLVVQQLLDRGLGSAGVAMHAATPKGVHLIPLSTIRACLPVVGNPANLRRAVPATFGSFRYGFANNLSPSDARAAFERYVIPAAGRPLFQAAMANFSSKAATTVDFAGHDRPPLLITTGGKDHLVPASIGRATYRKYRKSKARTDLRHYPDRSHATFLEPGWEQVAQDILDWHEQV